MRTFKLLILLSAVLLAGCSSMQEPLIVQRIDMPLFTDTEALANMTVETKDNGEWWVLDGYKPQVFTIFGHGYFYDDICRPDVEVLATVTRPTSHPFIHEDLMEAERARLLRERAAGIRVVMFDLAPMTLDDLEKEFLDSALPRAKLVEPSHGCYGWH